ncbi:MAG: DUF814 domain-containing protein [bacterium]|nr:DUF814 domain-containing protein [bacterium]
MDNLVLVRVVRSLDDRLRRAVLRDLHEDAPWRFRLVFEAGERPASVAISLRPEMPWLGRPGAPRPRTRRPPSPFASTLNRTLRGLVVERLTKPPADRSVTLLFVEGHALVFELATHRANLVLLDERGRVVDALRRPRSDTERLATGAVYESPRRPARLMDPFENDAAALDRHLDEVVDGGESPLEAVRRHLFGVGTAGAQLVLAESRACGESAGAVLARRMNELREGRLDPAIEAAEDPRRSLREGRAARGARLWPWSPDAPAAGHELFREADPAATAGVFYDASEAEGARGARVESLVTLLEREIDRLRGAERRAQTDLEALGDPSAHKRHGEALLAGLSSARRVGEIVFVLDPYDAAGAEIPVPAKPGEPLPRVVDRLFQRYRRAKRGIEKVRLRAERLRGQRERLIGLRDSLGEHPQETDVDALEQSMRELDMPVGLEVTRAARSASRLVKPRLEGVRMLTSSDGMSILAGRSGRENQRLTFRLAAPEDFWFHALGVPGAHVVVRNDQRRRKPPEATLREAAQVAAWYSEAKEQRWVDVQWTRRRYVRKARGASPGTVILKRYETIRVEPRLPVGIN